MAKQTYWDGQSWRISEDIKHSIYLSYVSLDKVIEELVSIKEQNPQYTDIQLSTGHGYDNEFELKIHGLRSETEAEVKSRQELEKLNDQRELVELERLAKKFGKKVV